LKGHEFEQAKADPCLYIKKKQSGTILIGIYVDDLIITASDMNILQETKNILCNRFKMKDMGELKFCLGIQVERNDAGIKIHQSKYIKDILVKFNMEHCNTADYPMSNIPLQKPFSENAEGKYPFRELVGSLLYVSIATRPDITYSVSQLSRHLNNFDETHWTAAKRVLRYLKRTQDYGLFYHISNLSALSFAQQKYNGPKSEEVENRKIKSFSDADFGGTKLDRRSVSGNVNLFAGAAISWRSQVQPTVALSTLEAEYMAMSKAAQEVIWLKLLFTEIGILLPGTAVTINGDNQGCLSTVVNHKITHQVKHIDIRHHFIRERVESGDINVEHVPTSEMVADVLTKPLIGDTFKKFRTGMGIQ